MKRGKSVQLSRTVDWPSQNSNECTSFISTVLVLACKILDLICKFSILMDTSENLKLASQLP